MKLFVHAVSVSAFPVQLIGYDIEKPDLIKAFDKIKFGVDEVFASFPKIDNTRCKYCGACVSFCNCGALHLDRNTPAIILNPEKCEACGECIEGCSIHGIATRERLTGYVLQGRMEGHAIALGKADDTHDFLVPLGCALNRRVAMYSISICDMGPGTSGYVLTALKNTTLAIIVLKPVGGWKRNIHFLQCALKGKNIPFSIVINKFRDETWFADEVQEFCELERVSLLGIIPFMSFGYNEKTFSINANGLENESIFASIWEKVAGR